MHVLRVPRFLGEILENAAELELQAAVELGAGSVGSLPLGSGTVVGRLRVPTESNSRSEKDSPTRETSQSKDTGEVVGQVLLDEPVLRSLVPQNWDRASLENSKPNQIPTSYDLRIYPDNPNMQVFSIDTSDELACARIEGTVVHIGALQPRLDDALRAMHRCRAAMHQTTLRKIGKRVRPISDSELRQTELKRLRPDAESNALLTPEPPAATTRTAESRPPIESSQFPGVRRAAQELEAQYTRKIKDRLNARALNRETSARAISDAHNEDEWRESITERIFSLFEKQFWWRLNELADNLGVSATRLKPVISELCDYNQRGPYRGMYSLKDHLKTQNQRILMDNLFQRREAELEAARQERDREREDRRREREAIERAAKRAQLAAESDYVDSLLPQDRRPEEDDLDRDVDESAGADYADES
jgi:AraC-like DNA-binding protein